MKLADFEYELPPGRIAQRPTSRREDARLLVLGRRTGAIDHTRIGEIGGLLHRGDLLVLNDTRVVPARLIGRKSTGGRLELLLLARGGEPGTWSCLLQAGRPPAPGSRFEIGGGLAGTILGRDAAVWSVILTAAEGTVEQAIAEQGRIPLPPYVRRDRDDESAVEDRERYQTVYASTPGAVAAPTAGLHFTHELLTALADRGIERAHLTLHVGPGTFLPVRVEDVEQHRMHAEPFIVGEPVAEAIARARQRGGRVVAVGTTTVRALETCAIADGHVEARAGHADLFIVPGFRFRVVDALLTNFHLPRSTLLMLVSAFAGRERLLGAYAEAIRSGYRFYSYGDAMLIRDA